MLSLNKIIKTQKEFTSKKRRRKENQQNKNSNKIEENKKKVSNRQRKETILARDTVCAENINTNYKIENCKSVMASKKDFLNIIKYIQTLWDKDESSTGIIKITPPTSWRKVNDFIFDNFYMPNFKKSEKKLETRIQNLGGLCEGKKFKFVKKYNFREYVQEAEKMEEQFLPKEYSKDLLEKIASFYWDNVTKKNYGNTSIETKYAADHSYSYFLTKNDFTKISEILDRNNTWNLSSIYKETDSLFQFLRHNSNNHISGLTTPWVYFGMLFSTFCWHVEDLYMYSINYMYYGNPKIWYSVSYDQKEALDSFIKKKKMKLCIEDPYILHKLILLVDPQEMIENGIKVFKGVQYPGDLIVTLPKAYHAGFSTGFNIAEAVNVATMDWTDFGFQACKDYLEESSKIPVFPMEWLFHQNFKFSINSEFSSNDEQFKILKIYDYLTTAEKTKRKKLEDYLHSLNIRFQILKIPDKENYTKTECSICFNYGYFSYIKCGLCSKKKCLGHILEENFKLCTCSKPLVLLHYRDISIIKGKDLSQNN